MPDFDKADIDKVTLTLDRAVAAEALQSVAASLSAGASSAGVSGWRALPNAPVASSRTDDIWFADEDTGWCVNSNGEVWRTDDGGDNWTLQLTVPQDHPAKPYLRTIHFAPENPDVGWFGVLCGAQDSYLDILAHHTTDGGQTWTPVTNLPQGVPQGICGISVVNAEVMYGSGSNEPGANVIGPGIIKTVDGGQTWTLIDMSKHATNLIDIWFEDEQHGYVVGGRTDDWCPGNQPWYRNYRQAHPGSTRDKGRRPDLDQPDRRTGAGQLVRLR